MDEKATTIASLGSWGLGPKLRKLSHVGHWPRIQALSFP